MITKLHIKHWDKIIMSRCFDHNPTFPDTHRHFHLAIGNSRRITIVCKGSRAQNEQRKKQRILECATYKDNFEMFVFRTKKCFWAPT